MVEDGRYVNKKIKWLSIKKERESPCGGEMKKILSFLAVLCFFGFVLLAEQSYSVKAVSGKVSYRQKDGSWAPVMVGMDLSSSTKVATGLNSTMIVRGAEKTIVILPLETGNVSDVVIRCSGSVLKKADSIY